MTDRVTPSIVTRKQPKQARPADLVAAILQAAVQVLVEQGAPRFTTARVAEKAGVSIGSLYQYFPNKAAILFRLQSDEWRQTSGLFGSILEDRTRPPLARLRRLVVAFIQSECDEAAVRGALEDAAPLYRDAPEAVAVRAAAQRSIDAFMHEVLPDAADATRVLAAELVVTTLKAVGKSFSTTQRSADEIGRYAEAMADMFCAYLEATARRP